MRLESNDSEILERNKNIKSIENVKSFYLTLLRAHHLVCLVFFISYGTLLCRKQYGSDQVDIDYRYINYFRKSLENGPFREELFYKIKYHQSKRDYFTPSLRSINHLIQIDEKPNLGLIEARRELYKISVSFFRIRKLYCISYTTFIDDNF